MASDYRVPDFETWWHATERGRVFLRQLGAHHLVVYRSVKEPGRVRHAELLTDRILLLEGLPNYQRLMSLSVGETVREQFEADLAIEVSVIERLRPGIVMCREKGDATSANLLEMILAEEETDVDYLQTQLELMDKLGEPLYLAQCMTRPPS
jgi:bacterioferritin